MPSRRVERLNHIMREEISDLLQRGINDPRLTRFISITRVDVSQDVKQAKVFVSVLGDDSEKKDAIRGFIAAGGFIRKELGRRIPIRSIPELSFALDESIASGERVLSIIKQVSEPGDGNLKI
jgi:ribosome-binding factor A